MNVYIFRKATVPPSQSALRALGLASFLGNEFDVREQELVLEVPFSLSNIGGLVTNNDALVQLAYSSNHQSVIENFDKPVVETGDIVVVAVKQEDEGSVKSFYDDYIQLPNVFRDRVIDESGEPLTVVFSVFIGLSNSNQSEFNDPFAGFTKVVFNTDGIQKILAKYGLDGNDEYSELYDTVDEIVENRLAQSIQGKALPSVSRLPYSTSRRPLR